MDFYDFEKGKSYVLRDTAGREFAGVWPHQFEPEAWELLILDPWESWIGFGPIYDIDELAATMTDIVENGHPHPGCHPVALIDMEWEEVATREVA